jgi:hypothetical protein
VLGVAAHEDVLGDGELAVEARLLVDGGDPQRLGVARVMDVHRLVVEADGPGVRLIDPGDDLDEGGLAGAVLADQGVHLAGTHVEVHMVERLDARKGFADVLQLQEGCGHDGSSPLSVAATPAAGLSAPRRRLPSGRTRQGAWRGYHICPCLSKVAHLRRISRSTDEIFRSIELASALAGGSAAICGQDAQMWGKCTRREDAVYPASSPNLAS